MTDPTSSGGGEDIGTARINLVVNSQTFDSSITASERAVAQMSQSAQEAYNQLNAAEKRRVDSLIRQADLLGKTRAEQIAYNAETKIGGDLGAEIAAKALAQQAAMAAASGAAKELAGTLNTFSDAQLFKVNQALATFKANAAQAALASGAGAGETDAQAAARIAAMVQASAAEQIAANTAVSASNAETAASATASAAAQVASEAESVAALNAATLAKGQAYARLQLAMQGNLATAAGMAEAEFALDEAMAAGAISASEQAAYFARLAAAETAATVATEANTAANVENAASFSLNARATRELGAIVDELASGNFGRLKTSLAAFANQSGLIKAAFSATGAAVIAAGAAIALFVTGLVEGSNESERLEKSVIASGNALAASGSQLNASAVAVGRLTGEWGDARKAIELLASSGQAGGAGFAGIAEQAVNMAKVTGLSIDKAVQEIDKIGEKPAETIAKLNEQYHFLTVAQYDQIAALEAEGRTRDAARIADQADADAMAQRAQQIEANAGLLERAGHAVAQAWDKAWDSIKGIGRGPSIGDQIAEIQNQIKQLTTPHLDRAGNLVQQQGGAQLASLQAQLAQLQTKQATDAFDQSSKALQGQLTQDAIAAQQRLAKFDTPKDVLDNTLKQANEDHLKALYGVVDPAKRAQINAEYEDQVKEAHNAYLRAIKKLEGPKTPDPYQSLNGLVQRAQVDDNNFGLDDNRQTKQVQQILAIVDAGAKLIASHQNVAKVQAEVATGVAALNDLYAKQAAQLKEKNAAAIEQYVVLLDKQNDALQKNVDNQVARLSMGSKEYERQQQLNEVMSKGVEQVQKLQAERDAVAAKDGDTSVLDKEITLAQANIDKQLQIVTKGYARIDAAQEDWKNGAVKAFEDFRDSADNVAGQADQAFTNLFDGMANGVADFVTTGKLNFKSLVTSFLTDLARMEARILESKALSAIFSSFGGGSSGSGVGFEYSSGNGPLMSSGYDSSMFAASANGNVFASADLSRYSGQIVDRPTTFAFAKGAGLMGEAGPEAIMPLTRTSDGKLGVTAPGGGGGVVVNLAVNVDNKGGMTSSTSSSTGGNSQADIARQFGERMKQVSLDTIANQLLPGGLLWKMKHA